MSGGSRIREVLAWEALDSRGRPTVACAMTLEDGSEAEALVPSGASTGSHEAHELRDGGERYGGRGVTKAVASVNGPIREALSGADSLEQEAIDRTLCDLDGTPSLERLGANAVLAASLACARASSAHLRQPLYRRLATGAPLLPMPMVNVLSGGLHAGRLVDVQDFLVVPVGASTFREAIEWCWRVREAAAELIAAQGGLAHLVADEGGVAARLESNQAGVELLARAIERSGLRPAEEAAIALDLAATHFHQPDGYRLAAEDRTLDRDAWGALLVEWCARWPIVSLEDPLAEDDWEGWREITPKLGARQVLGDDLFVTNPERLRQGVESGAANAVLVKINQNGTISGAAEVARQAHAAGYATVVSARSGETEDSSLSDLAVAWRAGQVKVGSTTRSERTAKWNRLLRIEAELGGEAELARFPF